MKSLILTLLVLVVFSQGEALKCYCGGTTKPCLSRVETCKESNHVCATIIFDPIGPHISSTKGCMTAHDCHLLSNSNVSYGYCCSTDLCNNE